MSDHDNVQQGEPSAESFESQIVRLKAECDELSREWHVLFELNQDSIEHLNDAKDARDLAEAKCAAIGQLLESIQKVIDDPESGVGETVSRIDSLLALFTSTGGNPGQALLKYVKALERVRELLATFCEPIRIEIEERGEVGDDYDRFWRGQLAIAEKALAACEEVKHGE